MTFNQWCAGKHLDHESRRAFEATWDELSRLGCHCANRLLDDIYESASANNLSWDDEDDDL